MNFIKYIFSKKYREEYSKEILRRFTKIEENMDNIYFEETIELKEAS